MADALVENPADVTRLILREVYGQIGDELYEETSWTTTRAKQVAAGLKWSTRFTPMPLSTFLPLAGLAGRSDIYLEAGQWRNVYRDRGAAPVVRDNRTLIGEPRFAFTPRTELVTRVTVLWDYDDAHGTWRKSRELISTQELAVDVQRGRKSKDDEPKTLELRFVRHDETAFRLGQYWLSQWDKQHLTVAIRGTWEALALEKGDLFVVQGHPVPTPYGTTWFRVRSKSYQLDSDEIELTGVEEPAAVMELAAQWRARVTQLRFLEAAWSPKTWRLLSAAFAPVAIAFETPVLLPGDPVRW